MKRLALIPAIALAALFTKTADAQIGINVGFHFGRHPIYVPAARVAVEAPVYEEAAPVDDNYGDDYYYLPDVDAYYDIAAQCYFYNDGYNWASAAYLPGYRDYDWRSARHYEVRANRPYLHDDFYRNRYDGHPGNWGRADARAYAERGFNHDGYGNQAPRIENRGEDYNGYRNEAPRVDNRNNGWNGQQTERFQTPRQFEQFNRLERQNNNFSQPSNDGRGRGNVAPAQPVQPAPENRGQNNQPSNNHSNVGGGQQHFTNNNMRGGMDRMGRS